MSRIPPLKDNPAIGKLLVAVGVVILSLIVFTFLSLIMAVLVYNVKLDQLMDPLHNIKEPGILSSLTLMQTISSIGGFILPAFFLAFLMNENVFSYLRLNRLALGNSFVLIAIMILTLTPFINWLMELNGRLVLPQFMHGIEQWMRKSEDDNSQLTKYFLDMHSFKDVLFNLVMIALIPAIGEELLFRGVLQRILRELFNNHHVAIFVSAGLFSALHMQFFGFVPRMLLGVLFGYLLVWSGSLWLPILGHFINNGAAVVFTYLFQNQLSNIDPDKIGTESNQWIETIISGFIMIGIMLVIRKIEKKRRENELVNIEFES